MRSRKTGRKINLSALDRVLRGALAALLAGACMLPAGAQTLGEMNAAQEGFNTLNSQSVGPNPGTYMPPPGTIPGAPVDPNAGQGGFFPGAAPPGMMPGPVPGFPGALPGGAQQAVTQAAAPIIPKIKVIAGTRVFDAITGELLDDAIEKEVAENEKGEYFDDGTNGDVEANDGKYTKVDERRDVIGQVNQRVKERLVKAVLSAEEMNPLQFYGFSLMSTERHEAVSRGRAWKLVPDPKGGPGFVLSEEPISEPLPVPKYRKWQEEKDIKVKEDWARRFLQEYRLNKDSLTSEFYALYIPQPPPMPTVKPPDPQAWQPFSDPGAQDRVEGQTSGVGNNMMPGGLGPAGMGGMPGVGGGGGASSKYF